MAVAPLEMAVFELRLAVSDATQLIALGTFSQYEIVLETVRRRPGRAGYQQYYQQ